MHRLNLSIFTDHGFKRNFSRKEVHSFQDLHVQQNNVAINITSFVYDVRFARALIKAIKR